MQRQRDQQSDDEPQPPQGAYLTTSAGILCVWMMITSSIEPKSTDGAHGDALEKIRTLIRLHDDADRNPFRVDPVDAGGQNAIAGDDVSQRRDVVQLQRGTAVAAKNALPARPLDERADRASCCR